MKKLLLCAGVVALAGAGIAVAQAPIPQVQYIQPTDLFQDIQNGNPQAGNVYAPATMMANYAAGQPGNNAENALIGGDATTNLFQRATTGSSVTTAVTYGGPDRWAYWSGTSTAMTVSRDSTAGDLSSSYKYAFKMARTSGQTGVVQVCMMQELEGVNSYRFAGQTAELDFHAVTGANFSAASGNIQAYIISGTGADEGTVNAAFGLNAGGGGSAGWTTQVNWAATITAGVSSSARYTIAAPIPAGTTEVAVALCFTPVGTAGTNDYIAFSGIQLTPNNGLSSLVSANASGTATALNTNDTRAKSFLRRPQGMETALQYRYHWQITDPAATVPIPSACFVTTANTTVKCGVWLPVTQRAVPATTVGTATSFGIGVTAGTAGTCTTLAATAASNTLNSIGVTCTTGGTIALGSATPLIGAAVANAVLQADSEL